MATITFKAKPQTMLNIDDTVAYRYVPVPTLARKHCDMHAFRTHPKYGTWANSDLFPGVLARIAQDTFGGSMLKLDRIPDNVTVDESGFLAVVTITV